MLLYEFEINGYRLLRQSERLSQWSAGRSRRDSQSRSNVWDHFNELRWTGQKKANREWPLIKANHHKCKPRRKAECGTVCTQLDQMAPTRKTLEVELWSLEWSASNPSFVIAHFDCESWIRNLKFKIPILGSKYFWFKISKTRNPPAANWTKFVQDYHHC